MGTTFADLLGKLPVVRVECTKCGRFGRYPLHRLIDRHGGDGTIIDWLDALTADCPRKARGEHQRPMPRAVSRSAQGGVKLPKPRKGDTANP